MKQSHNYILKVNTYAGQSANWRYVAYVTFALQWFYVLHVFSL